VHRDIWEVVSVDHGLTFDGRKLHTWEINACQMSSMSFAEGAGDVVGAWETSGQVYFEQLGKSDSVRVGAPGVGGGRKHPRIAVDRGGRVLLIWTEGTGWQKGGSLAWQEFGVNRKAIGEVGRVPGIAPWSFGAAVATPGGFLVVY
jgi:hypothetical protein